MKKAIAILLVLLVAGVAFGADNITLATAPTYPGDVQITIGAPVNGVVRHIFSSTAVTSYGGVNSATAIADAINIGDFSEGLSSVPLANYAFSSNAKTGVKVTLTPEPLKAEVSSGVYNYVPYSVSMTVTGNTDETITAPAVSFTGSAGLVAPTTDPVVLYNYDENKPVWMNYQMAISTLDYNGEIVEGDYRANLTVEIAAK